jgi:hypothetical protein
MKLFDKNVTPPAEDYYFAINAIGVCGVLLYQGGSWYMQPTNEKVPEEDYFKWVLLN